MRVRLAEVGFIYEVVELVKDISIRILLRRGSTTEVLNNRLDISVIEAEKYLEENRKGTGRGGGRGNAYDCYIYPGRECIGGAFEVFGDYVRLTCVARHEI